MRSGKRFAAFLLLAVLVLAGCSGAREKRLTLYTSFGADLYTPLAGDGHARAGIGA